MRQRFFIPVFFLIVLFACDTQNTTHLVVNPYENVDWSTFQVFKANLHTHTTHSDGSIAPHEVIDAYHKAGYKILALTDHSKITWAWDSLSFLDTTYENRDADELGMLAVKGNELSGGYHIGNYFNVLAGDGANTMRALDQIEERGGLAVLNHPGRYWKIDKKQLPDSKYSEEWFQNYFNRYPALVGLEVFNMAGERYPNDRVLWDELLLNMMPDRPIWGYSNDDMHHSSHLFHGYQYMLMSALSEENMRKCMKEGATILVREPKGNGVSRTPKIDSIIADEKNQSIIAFARDYKSIQWISGVNGKDSNRVSHVIAMGKEFSYQSYSKPYVRVVLENEYGMTCSQPFGFDCKEKDIAEEKHTSNEIKESEKPEMEWVEIPAGSFTMGSPPEEISRIDDEIEREIFISSFKLSKHEVTFEQFDLFCEATGRTKPYDEGMGRGQRPVINVSWDDANAFAKWMGGRLPTEAEWEYACKAGTTTPYNTGNCLGDKNAAYNAAYPNGQCGKGLAVSGTMPVGSYSPNAWGLYDMHGNVYEWCSDWSGEYEPGSKRDPKGSDAGSGKIYRGGSWVDWERSCRSSFRSYSFKRFKSPSLGFRICK